MGLKRLGSRVEEFRVWGVGLKSLGFRAQE